MTSTADIRDINRAIAAIDKIAERHGDDWDGYEFDQISRARAEMIEWREQAKSETTREP